MLRISLEGGPLSVAWSHPAGGVWAAGAGVAAEGDGEIAWEGERPDCPGPWFGGWSFEGVERWVLPKLLAWWSGGRTWVAAFGDDRRESLARLAEAQAVALAPAAAVEEGDRRRWSRLVDAALCQIEGGALNKAVVARELRVEAVRPFDERRILKALETRFPTCRTFLQRMRDGAAFLGATPERLCRVKGRVVETEALAGTGTGEELMSSQKNLREHAWVVEAIVEALRPLTTDLELEPIGLKRLSNLTHLWTPICATLREGVEGMQVARALHPTPAVGGVPRSAALAFLQTHEGFDRGWYGGAIGLRGEDSLELCVAIRSARVSGSQAIVYAGAGIVAGSTPDSEWAETERKAGALLGALGVGGAA